MIVAPFMAVLSGLGVVFYARFLYALCKELRHNRICYLVCLRTQSPEHAVMDHHELEESRSLAA